LIFGIIA